MTRRQHDKVTSDTRQPSTARVTTDESDPIVYIRRQWNAGWDGSVKLSQISGLHWSSESGGVMAPAPRPFLHGYVWCTDVQGGINHSCRHGPPPHRIKVCLVKKSNRAVWDRLLAEVEAGRKSKSPVF